ncbi:MAG TPA: DUF892 family protein [Dehalococcoidia bacterium]|nr:DUF892 family protein [Dehalococcoidia bacterium]
MEETMQINNFKEMYFAELSELHSVEKQLVEALGKMAAAAAHDGLRQAFLKHREETEAQRDRVRAILDRHGVNPDMHVDQSMVRLVDESEKMKSILANPDLADAGLIASAQRIEHYEIAVYGTVATYADLLELPEDRQVLHQILEEEKATDAKLTMLATQVVNRDALKAA